MAEALFPRTRPDERAALSGGAVLAAVYAYDRLRRDSEATSEFLERVVALHRLSLPIGLPALRHALAPSCRSRAHGPEEQAR